jgi:hypothetical protein
MIHGLTGLRCSGNHEHQIIEGQALFQGQRISRSSFTEHYSRKIARILAMILGKVHKPYETPYHFDRIEMILGPFWQQRNIRRLPSQSEPV